MRCCYHITLPHDVITGNFIPKYDSNPVHRMLVGRFIRDARDLLALVRYENILDVGCGKGELGAIVFPRLGEAGAPSYTGVDIGGDQIAAAQSAHPDRRFLQADACALPFADASFDLVIACEVLEHLPDPDRALREMRRVCRGHMIASVPWEPVWRILNVLRGAYVSEWGNTPGHFQHFSRARFRDLVSREWAIIAERRPFPWTMILGRAE